MAIANARVTRAWDRVDDTLSLSSGTPVVVQNAWDNPIWLFEGTSTPVAGFGESLDDDIQILVPYGYIEINLAAGDELYAYAPHGDSRLVY